LAQFVNPDLLLVFTRYPEPGKVKTRLIPALGKVGAANLHQRLTAHTLRLARAGAAASRSDLIVRFDGGGESAMQQVFGEAYCYEPQGPGDLGPRLERAFTASFQQGRRRVVLIGSDCPGITAPLLHSAFARLIDHDLVLGPANDGGYYLIGLREPQPELFQDLPWGTAQVLTQTLEKAAGLGLRLALLESLTDIDRPEDLLVWEEMAQPDPTPEPALLSVIIPALNEAALIERTLSELQAAPGVEIIVADGGSTDATASLAAAAGVTVLQAPRGRARQQNLGAAAAAGEILFFVHADTLVPQDYARLIRQALESPGISAGAFSLKIAGRRPGLKAVSTMANLRSRWLHLPYGDQGLFLPARVFWRLGGFPDQAIMEDFALVRQARQYGRVITLDQTVLTSGRRWQHLGLGRTFALNQLMIFGYYLGVAPPTLARLYRRSAAT
jgi:uncharacterized protein